MRKCGIVLVLLIIIFMTGGGTFLDRSRTEEGGKVPTIAEVSKNPYIYRYNHELCKEKGLTESTDHLSGRYLYMQAVYRANLDAYLLKTLDIGELDEELGNGGLGLVSLGPEEQNLYERESTMELRHICLRNNLYIEYLRKDQLCLLEDQLSKGKLVVTDEIQDMVKETYREVIRVRNPGNWEDDESFLYAEAQGLKPKIPNSALVLEISGEVEYDASGNLLSDGQIKEKYEYLDRIKEEKEKEYSGLLGTKVYILLE